MVINYINVNIYKNNHLLHLILASVMVINYINVNIYKNNHLLHLILASVMVNIFHIKGTYNVITW